MKNNYIPSDDPAFPFGDRLKNSDGFVLPDNYFEGLADQILQECPSHPINETQFKVPEAYFDTLSDRIINHVEKRALPFDIKNESFKLPDGYFENFPEHVMHRISKDKSSKVRTFLSRRVFMYSIAASVLLCVSVLVLRWYSASPATDFLSSCSEEELLEYVSTYSTEFNADAFASIMNTADLNALDFIDKNNEEVDELLEYFE